MMAPTYQPIAIVSATLRCRCAAQSTFSVQEFPSRRGCDYDLINRRSPVLRFRAKLGLVFSGFQTNCRPCDGMRETQSFIGHQPVTGHELLASVLPPGLGFGLVGWTWWGRGRTTGLSNGSIRTDRYSPRHAQHPGASGVDVDGQRGKGAGPPPRTDRQTQRCV